MEALADIIGRVIAGVSARLAAGRIEETGPGRLVGRTAFEAPALAGGRNENGSTDISGHPTLEADRVSTAEIVMDRRPRIPRIGQPPAQLVDRDVTNLVSGIAPHALSQGIRRDGCRVNRDGGQDRGKLGRQLDDASGTGDAACGRIELDHRTTASVEITRKKLTTHDNAELATLVSKVKSQVFSAENSQC